MSNLTAGRIPLGVRIKNSRYDGMVTGWLHDAPKFQEADPGGMIAASFTLDQRLGFRSDIIQPYSRCYITNKRNGDVVFEGDITWPGRGTGDQGQLFEIQVDGPVARLEDWSGARIFIDRDMEAWKKTQGSVVATSVEPGEDRGGSGNDALNLNFDSDTHVEVNFRCEAGYHRILEAGQTMGWFNYSWDCGVTNASWIIRSIGTPPSTVIRSQTATTGGSGGSGAVWGGSIIDGMNEVYIQMLWNSGPSNTGGSGADVVWTSYMTLQVQAKLYAKNGTFRPAGEYNDTVPATAVVGDLLGDPNILGNVFDGANAIVDTGSGYGIRQLAYPDGVTPKQVFDDLMQMEQACTYLTGASNPLTDEYSFNWVARSTVPRYEALLWMDEHGTGTQTVDQYNRAVARWRTPVGNLRISVATQAIPEMDDAGRTRTFFQDLSNTVGFTENADQANATVLADHRYPLNTGQVRIARPIVDLWTGLRVEPFDIKPSYLIRLVGVEPHPDGLNATAANGVTVCRIVGKDYDADTNSVDLDLDGVPLSMLRAIRATKKSRPPNTRKV